MDPNDDLDTARFPEGFLNVHCAAQMVRSHRSGPPNDEFETAAFPGGFLKVQLG